MSYFETVKPTSLLAPYVTALWVYDDVKLDAQQPWVILPDTASYVCFLCSDPVVRAMHKKGIYTARSGLSGFQTYRFDIDYIGSISGVTVCLTAWGLSAFLGDAAGACTDIRVECDDLFPRAFVDEVEGRLFNLKTARERARLVESALLSRLRAQPGTELVRRACMRLRQTAGIYAVKDLARDFGMSERTLERYFLRFVGTTPKKYARVLRLCNALSHKKQISSWADVASATGYYDQSHLIRDCQEIYGGPPESTFHMVLESGAIQSDKTYSITGERGGRVHREHLVRLLDESYEPL